MSDQQVAQEVRMNIDSLVVTMLGHNSINVRVEGEYSSRFYLSHSDERGRINEPEFKGTIQSVNYRNPDARVDDRYPVYAMGLAQYLDLHRPQSIVRKMVSDVATVSAS